jgi:ubiquinone/menaquinone biosynthesis C-methylase UbiE
MPNTRGHWDNTYASKPENGVSWYQANPSVSLRLIHSAAPDHSSPIVDIGGGASRLTDCLLSDGFTDLTVLDISEVALSRAQARLKEAAQRVTWIVSDITQWQPPRSFAVWHDRAVFHFLTAPDQQDAYIRALMRGTKSGSAVIIATFSLCGPERCSGLPVKRYSADSLSARLGADFELYEQVEESHKTPFGTAQDFIYAAFRRR